MTDDILDLPEPGPGGVIANMPEVEFRRRMALNMRITKKQTPLIVKDLRDLPVDGSRKYAYVDMENLPAGTIITYRDFTMNLYGADGGNNPGTARVLVGAGNSFTHPTGYGNIAGPNLIPIVFQQTTWVNSINNMVPFRIPVFNFGHPDNVLNSVYSIAYSTCWFRMTPQTDNGWLAQTHSGMAYSNLIGMFVQGAGQTDDIDPPPHNLTGENRGIIPNWVTSRTSLL